MKQTIIFEISEAERKGFMKACSDFDYIPTESGVNTFTFTGSLGAEFMDELDRVQKDALRFRIASAPVGFRDVSDKNADGLCFVHDSLPIAVCTEDDGTSPELYAVEFDDEENKKARTPQHFHFVRSILP